MEHRQKVLTNRVTAAGSVDEVLSALEGGLAEGVEFDAIHGAAALCELAQRSPELSTAHVDSRIFSTLTDETRAALQRGDVSGHTVANILWAVASLLKTVPALEVMVLDAVSAARNRADTMTLQALSDCIWAIGMMQSRLREHGLSSADFVRSARHVLHRGNLDHGSKRSRFENIATLSWGLALSGQREYWLLGAVAGYAVSGAPRAAKQAVIFDIPRIAWAFATLHRRHDRLFAAIAECVPSRVSALQPWALGALAWSFARLYPPGSTGADGIWRDRGVITGTRLLWEGGRVADVSVTGSRSCSLRLDGDPLEGRVSDDGQTLLWSDGDAWARAAHPFPEFVSLLAAEVGRRGLLGSVHPRHLDADGVDLHLHRKRK